MPAPAGLLELCSTSSTMPVLLRGVDRQQLHVAGFVEPAMRDHSLTGLCVHMLFAEAPEPVEVLLGQSLSIDLSDSPAAERIVPRLTDDIRQQQFALHD